jgi:pSer/pThr/pTyr-binding forkhead associated (FHA) protein
MPVQFSSKEAAGKLFPMLKVWGDRPGHPAVALNRPVCLIGRRGMHLSLESQTVSRTHALIINDARHVYIRDLASRNGTSVNGEAVHEAELAESAVIRIGSYALRCEAGFPKSPDDAPVPQAAPVELHVDGHPVRIPAGQKTVLIGRREGCEIQLVDEDASPVHAVLFQLAGKHHVRDLNSENGTFVNGQPVRQAVVHDGDEIRIGRTKIGYTISGGEAAGSSDPDATTDLDDVLGDALDQDALPESAPVSSTDDVLGDAPAGPDADLDADIDVDVADDADGDFGSTALESNYEQLAATPLPARLMGELDEPEGEDSVESEASSREAESKTAGAPTSQPASKPAEPSSLPERTASDQSVSRLTEADVEYLALEPGRGVAETSVLLTGAAPDRLADAPSDVAVDAGQMRDSVDASSGPIAMDDDDLLDILSDEDEDDAEAAANVNEPADDAADTAEAAASSAESKAPEVLDAPAEVVDGKVVSPPPFADKPLKASQDLSESMDVARPSGDAPGPGIFAKADLVEPARPPGLATGAAALPAPPDAPGIMPAAQPTLELMDDAVLADVVTRGGPHRSKQRPAPTRQRIRQLSRRVKDLSARVASLEAALAAVSGSEGTIKPLQGEPARAANAPATDRPVK